MTDEDLFAYAQKIADQQDPVKLNGIFRCPEPARGAAVFIKEISELSPQRDVEFHFKDGKWEAIRINRF